jgi:hypothetical protein
MGKNLDGAGARHEAVPAEPIYVPAAVIDQTNDKTSDAPIEKRSCPALADLAKNIEAVSVRPPR